jgi:heme/copper-type cytochrome/quinol oxidase subunit 3
MANPMLALPSGERGRPRNLATVGALVAGAGGLMGFGALLAAWVNVSHFTKPWPPKGVTIANYPGTMLAVTMLMSVVTVEWGVHANRQDNRGQALAGFGLTAGFAVAFLNLLWFFGRSMHLGVRSSAFATLLYAILAAAGVAAAVGVAAMFAVLARLFARQVGPANADTARAAAFYWHFVALGWILVTLVVWKPISL